jgi:hypothetical protein
MPLYDYCCPKQHITEHIAGYEEITTQCPLCGEMADRIISISGCECNNEDAAWIRSVADVVDRDGGVHCKEFIQNPTRSNYKQWMEKEGVRHIELGEKKYRAPEPDLDRISQRLWKRHQKRCTLEVNS